MDLELGGRHVLVAGGSRGIGLACAREFLREGCRVTLIGRDETRLAQACAALDAAPEKVHGVACDLSDSAAASAAVDRAEQKFGPVDVLVNTAGAAQRKPFSELTPQDWRVAFDVKFMTYINTMDPVVKRMATRGGGAVVNVIGMGGKVPTITHLAGGAANAALMLATAGLALAYGPRGVRINAINPSKTATDRVAEGIEAEARAHGISASEAMARAQRSMPVGRLATPEDVATAAVFLASPRAGYISGSIISMDGGARPMVV